MSSTKVISGLVIAIRFFLAIVFISYGVIKLLGGQFDYGDWVIDKKTTEGPGLVWAFYGYSWFYGRVLGLFELIPALMLLWRRTAALGASVLFAVSLNITLLDFSYHYPAVKYAALLYTILCGLLILHYRRKLMLAFWNPEEISELAAEVARRRAGLVTVKKPISKMAIAALIFLGIPLVAFALNVLGAGLTPLPEEKATTFLLQHGWRKNQLQFVSDRAQGFSGIGRTADLRFVVKGTNPPKELHVTATQANGFVGWHIDKVIEKTEAKP